MGLWRRGSPPIYVDFIWLFSTACNLPTDFPTSVLSMPGRLVEAGVGFELTVRATCHRPPSIALRQSPVRDCTRHTIAHCTRSDRSRPATVHTSTVGPGVTNATS